MADRDAPFSEGAQTFLRFWFDGFSRGLERLDPAAREAMLGECAAACGRSYTAAVFRRAWEGAAGELDRFLAALSSLGVAHRKIGPDVFEVSWDRCGCDLFTAGLVRTPLLCRCTVHSLRQNLEATLGRRAVVTMRATILGGDRRCVFEIALGDAGGGAPKGAVLPGG